MGQCRDAICRCCFNTQADGSQFDGALNCPHTTAVQSAAVGHVHEGVHKDVHEKLHEDAHKGYTYSNVYI
eukprot:135386-Pelagomonas_calceolata.AAC.1